jgi:hypothetical protein
VVERVSVRDPRDHDPIAPRGVHAEDAVARHAATVTARQMRPVSITASS